MYNIKKLQIFNGNTCPEIASLKIRKVEQIIRDIHSFIYIPGIHFLSKHFVTSRYKKIFFIKILSWIMSVSILS